MEIYLDGNLNISGASKNRTIDVADEAYIGKFQITGSLYHIGRVSLLHLYNRALTAQEIKQNYHATKKRYGL
jgi:hypothetical protein